MTRKQVKKAWDEELPVQVKHTAPEHGGRVGIITMFSRDDPFHGVRFGREWAALIDEKYLKLAG